uniref:RING-type E3 ubiquitin transferase n=1 Tax=Anthurium amnicola TaxID=1678845 RepID=A0A1D1XKF5_9ARAE
MGASSSRAGGRGGAGGGVVGTGHRGLVPKLQGHLRRSGGPQASPRRVAPSDHSSGAQNSSLNTDIIQGVDQAQLTGYPTVEPSVPSEQMLTLVKDRGRLNEEIVTSHVTQAIEALHIESDAEREHAVGCGLEGPDVHDEPDGMIEEEEDDCPICFEAFDEENPKLVTECLHHYHLSCLLAWMERSATCPICCQVALFNEPS